MQKNEDIRDAVEELENVSVDAQTRLRAELRLKAIRDEKAERAFAIEKGLEEGRARGLAEGRAEGKAEGKAEGIYIGTKNTTHNFVKKMLDEKIDLTIISKISGLTKEEILNMK